MTGWGRSVLAGAVWAAALVLGGCSAAAPAPVSSSPAPTVTASLPPGGVYLTTLGVSYAPAGFSIPAQVKPLNGYAMPGVVDVAFSGSDGPVVYNYLVANLAAMGYTITAQSDDSLLWNDDAWEGGFTMTTDRAAITLRTRTA